MEDTVNNYSTLSALIRLWSQFFLNVLQVQVSVIHVIQVCKTIKHGCQPQVADYTCGSEMTDVHLCVRRANMMMLGFDV